ncbi:unnamed protein product [Didymodactylos carnosus]|uniref:Uncharacterized protein n=1 Tax=Didymodactylos carnosus TaxID=1234261 RepID=A0A813VRY3_9BILA|nr:unnamed protein product [Didymodactylos carnosus]CAF0945972.1 unnamed protein product [Didymodactylos carnosus]CAF3633210.1 unnamed protein product [Didymodactylos carnosus]CAF3720598.1 unnamed protein product [Didymodactylos carnosus]
MTYFIWKSNSQIIENNLDFNSQSQSSNLRNSRNKQRSASKKKATGTTITTTTAATTRKEKKKAMKKLQQEQSRIEMETSTDSSNDDMSSERTEKQEQHAEPVTIKNRQKAKPIEDGKDVNVSSIQQPTPPKKPQASVAPTAHVVVQTKPVQQGGNKSVQQQQVKQNDVKPQQNQVLPIPQQQQLVNNKTQSSQQYVSPPTSVDNNEQQVTSLSQTAPVRNPNIVQQDLSRQRLPPRQQRSATNIQLSSQQQQNSDQQLGVDSRVDDFIQTEHAASIQPLSALLPQQQQQQRNPANDQQSQSMPVQVALTGPVQSSPTVQQNKPQINGFTESQRTQEFQSADTIRKVQPLSPPQQQSISYVPSVKMESSSSSSPTTVVTSKIKMIDLVKALPSTQALVAELMLIFDSMPLSYDELELIMYKIANKQCLIKHDWNRLFEKGQKVDPREHINSIMSDTLRTEMALIGQELQQEKKTTQELCKQLQDKEQLLRRYSSQPPPDYIPSAQHQNQLIGLQLQIRHLQDENQQLLHQINKQFLIHPLPQPLYEPQYSGQQRSNESLQQQISILTNQLQQMTIKNVTLEKQFKESETVKISFKKADILNQQRIEKLLYDINKLENNEQNVLQLKQDFNQLQTKYNELQEKQRLVDKQTLSNESELLKQEQKKYDDLERKYQILKQTLTKLEEKEKQQQIPHVDIVQIQKQLSQEQKLIEQLKLNYLELEKQYEVLKQNTCTNDDDLQQKQERIDQLEKEIEILKGEQQDKLQEQLKHEQEIVKQLQEKYFDLQIQNEAFKQNTQINDELRQKQAIIEQLIEENKQLKHEKELYNEQQNNSKKLQDELEKQSELLKQSSSKLESFQYQLKEKQEHIENLQLKLVDLEAQNQQITQRLDESQQQKNNVNIVNNHQSNDNNNNNELLKQIQLLTLELDELKQKNDILRKRNWKVMDELNLTEKLLIEQKQQAINEE